MRSYIYILLCLALNINSLYSQDLQASIKNEMVEFLYFKKEISDDSLNDYLKNIKNKDVQLFWYKEIDFSDTRIKAIKFGTYSEHSKEFVILVKGDNEKLFLGIDMKECKSSAKSGQQTIET